MVIDFLYKDFDLIIFKLLGYKENKTINKIQQILSSVEANFISKQKMGINVNLAHISRNNKPSYYQKQKAILNDKYYNYYKIGHFRQNCRVQDFRLAKRKASDTKQNNAPRSK